VPYGISWFPPQGRESQGLLDLFKELRGAVDARVKKADRDEKVLWFRIRRAYFAKVAANHRNYSKSETDEAHGELKKVAMAWKEWLPALEGTAADVRDAVARLVAESGAPADAMGEAFERVLVDPDPVQRERGLFACDGLLEVPVAIRRRIVELQKDPDPCVRILATHVAGKFSTTPEGR